MLEVQCVFCTRAHLSLDQVGVKCPQHLSDSAGLWAQQRPNDQSNCECVTALPTPLHSRQTPTAPRVSSKSRAPQGAWVSRGRAEPEPEKSELPCLTASGDPLVWVAQGAQIPYELLKVKFQCAFNFEHHTRKSAVSFQSSWPLCFYLPVVCMLRFGTSFALKPPVILSYSICLFLLS